MLDGSKLMTVGRRVFNYYKLKIADCVDVGERCVVEALSVGKGVKIGSDCTIVSVQSRLTLSHPDGHFFASPRESLRSSATTPSSNQDRSCRHSASFQLSRGGQVIPVSQT